MEKLEPNEFGEVSVEPKPEKKELFEQTTVYINAGGRGTRLESIFPKGPAGVTKALIEFDGKPMIQNHVDLLLKLGFKNIIVGAGDHSDIKDYFKGKENERLNIVTTETQEDTGGDLIKAVRENNDLGDNVIVENVDTVVYVKDIGELLLQHEKSGAAATIVLTTRKGVPNEGAFFVDEKGKVVYSREAKKEYGLKEPENWDGFQGSSTGTLVFNTDALRNYNWQSGSGALSIYRDIIPELIKQGKLYAYNNEGNFFTDTGTPDKYKQVKRHEGKLFGAIGKKYLEQIKK